MGECGKNLAPTNSARDAHAFINRWGLSWRVPYSLFKYQESGQSYEFSYLSPISFTKYLLEKAPQLVMGGIDGCQGRKNLESFWASYRAIDPEHIFFQEDCPGRTSSNTLAFAVHGDEGRGAKKGNTCIISMETVLGLRHPSAQWDSTTCSECVVSAKGAKRFKLGPETTQHHGMDVPPCAKQVTNLKEHSYLTKFVLGVLPNKYYKGTGVLDEFLTVLCAAFEVLFNDGVLIGSDRWYLCVVGLKGDLRWHEKTAHLERCFNKQLGHVMCMCHMCAAGSAEVPWEDSSHQPKWSQTLFPTRPWSEENVPSIVQIPCNPGKPEAIIKSDLFHNTKVGMLRDFVGSAVMMIIHFGFFHERGEGNSRDVLLLRAHSHFIWYCETTSQYPALHSFTPIFFNMTRSWHYPWVNAKGSDVTLMLSWLKVLAVAVLNSMGNEVHTGALESIVRAVNHVKGWERIVYGHGLWLTKTCGAVLYEHFHQFIEEYNLLAHLCLHQFRIPGFAKKAKQHMLMHAKYDLYVQLKDPLVKWVLNPNIWNCEMCEDLVGRLSRLSRRVSPQTPAKRSLDLYLIKCRAVYQRYKSKKL